MLEEILRDDNLSEALEKLKSKNDSAGIDGMKLSELEQYLNFNKRELIGSIVSKEFSPGIVKEIEILEKGGKRRAISLLNSIDRLILRAIHQVLYKKISPYLSEHSFAYKENTGIPDMLEAIRDYADTGFKYVVELDIEGYFDNISHEKMIALLHKHIDDARVSDLITMFIKSRIEKDHEIYTKSKGLIQGSPLSPLLSNLYLTDFDKMLESQSVSFVRFCDDVRLYTVDYEEALLLFRKCKDYLSSELDLNVSEAKSGVFPILKRNYFGYELVKEKDIIFIKKKLKGETRIFSGWHTSAVSFDSNEYHIISDGILTKKDFTILFDNKENKAYIPVEVTDNINVYSDIVFSSNFFKAANENMLTVSIFDSYSNYVGKFIPCHQKRNIKAEIKQVLAFADEGKRLKYAKQIIMAAAHNIKSNISYYNARKKTKLLSDSVKTISEYISQMNEATSIESLMLVEARMRSAYYKCFDEIIKGNTFVFDKRTKRPPQNEVNSLLSFGNTILYNKISLAINKSPLDIRISFLHSPNRRNDNLQLDIAEIYKPIIVDRVIFTLINKQIINKNLHFEATDTGGIYLNAPGKKIIIAAFEDKLNQKITLGGRVYTYETVIRNEIIKLASSIINDEPYKPFKYQY